MSEQQKQSVKPKPVSFTTTTTTTSNNTTKKQNKPQPINFTSSDNTNKKRKTYDTRDITSNEFTLGTFLVDIPSQIDNANVAPDNRNIITDNGSYPVPQGKTGWNSFEVMVPESGCDIEENAATLTVDDTVVDYVQKNKQGYLDLPNADVVLQELTQFDTNGESYATRLSIDLSQVTPQLPLQPGQRLTENAQYQIYDYQKDDDQDIRKIQTRELRLRETTRENDEQNEPDDPSYRNLGTFTVDVPVPEIEATKTVDIDHEGIIEITPSQGKDAMAKVVADVHVPHSEPYLYEGDFNVTSEYDGYYVRTLMERQQIEAQGLGPECVLRVEGLKVDDGKQVDIMSTTDTIIRPSSGYDVMSQVTVRPVLETKTITANGTYTPSSGYCGIGNIKVQVNSSYDRPTITKLNSYNVDDFQYILPSSTTVNYSKTFNNYHVENNYYVENDYYCLSLIAYLVNPGVPIINILHLMYTGPKSTFTVKNTSGYTLYYYNENSTGEMWDGPIHCYNNNNKMICSTETINYLGLYDLEAENVINIDKTFRDSGLNTTWFNIRDNIN